MPTEEERYSMSPGRNLNPKSAEALKEIREKLERMQAERRGEEMPSDGGCYKSVAPLAVKVNAIIEQNSDLKSLCGEILATFMLPQNAEKVAALGPQFPDVLAAWVKRFEKCGGEA